MSNYDSSNPLETALQSAHLLIMRHRYYEARMLLDGLATQFPGNADIANLLQETASHQVPTAPRRRREASFLPNRRKVTLAVCIGMAIAIAGLCAAVVSICWGRAYGWLGRLPTEPVWLYLLSKYPGGRKTAVDGLLVASFFIYAGVPLILIALQHSRDQ